MVSDVSGGNWYRIWAMHQIVDEASGKVKFGAEVVIVSDDKEHPFKLEYRSDEEADEAAGYIASQLRRNERPLFAILGIPAENLPPDVRRYDAKRMQWYWKAPDIR